MHLMGLIGAGGVHSNIEHLYALLNVCKQQQLTRVYIHGFTENYVKVKTPWNPELVNTLQEINLTKIDEEGSVRLEFINKLTEA